MPRNSQLWIFACLMALAVALGGCSEDDNAGAETQTDATVEPSPSEPTAGVPEPAPSDASLPGQPEPDTGSVEPSEPSQEPAPGGCTSNDECVAEMGELEACKMAFCDQTSGTCLEGLTQDGTPCDDGDACTEDTVCKTGTCGDGTSVNCDDDDSCTDDQCDAIGGCVNVPNTAPCDDGDLCTIDDACAQGECVGTTRDCGDDNPCTEDLCDAGSAGADPETGCFNPAADGAACDDGEECTLDDVCLSSQCVGGTADPECVACTDNSECMDDGNLCNGIPACLNGFCKTDPATEEPCAPPLDSCVTVECVPETGDCIDTAVEDGTPCDDGDACTPGDSCLAGVCTAGEPDPDCKPGCVPSTTAGCGGCACEECVCDIDAFCCDTIWDDVCAGFCANDCGQECDQEPTGSDPGCEPQGGPGCSGCGCEACVCALDSFCCETEWDSLCATSCGQDCGGNCATGPGPGPGTGNSCEDNCGGITSSGCSCEAACADIFGGIFLNCCPDYAAFCSGGNSSGEPGCVTSDVPGCGGCACEACVCAADSFCCTTSWDQICVDICISDCGGCETCEPVCDGLACGDDGCGGSCGTCESGSLCQGGQCEKQCGNAECQLEVGETCSSCPADCGACVATSGCTTAPAQATCGDCACQECVCAENPACCDTLWDDTCVAACLLDCGGCVEPAPAGCTADTQAGCEACACEECVCQLDPTCCDVAWDESCATSCAVDCGTACSVPECTSDAECNDFDPCTVDSCQAEDGSCAHTPVDGECCSQNADCDDEDLCTTDSCVAGSCVSTGGCCATDDECGGSDACVSGNCSIDGLCQFTASSEPGCCPQDGVLLNADFETAVGLEAVSSFELAGWFLSDAKAFEGDHSMWYHCPATGNLNCGVSSGSLVSQPFWVPSDANATLTFQYWTSDGETLRVEVWADGAWKGVWIEPGDSLNAWVEGSVSLDDYAGQQIAIRFFFKTLENQTGDGLFLDNVQLVSGCASSATPEPEAEPTAEPAAEPATEPAAEPATEPTTEPAADAGSTEDTTQTDTTSASDTTEPTANDTEEDSSL